MMEPNEFKSKLRGVINLQMTPFTAAGDLDEPGLKAGVRNVVQRCAGEEVVILGLGSTGEFYAMSDKEINRATEIIVEEVNGAFPVLIGSARAATRETIAASQTAQKIGADAVMVVHPFYTMPIEEEVVNHYRAVADAIDIGLVVYNNSATSKLWLPTETIRELSKVDNIIGLKENTSNPMQFLAMLDGLDPADISIFAGLGHAMYQFMCSFGCTGYVTEISNYAPELALGLLKAGQTGDTATVRATAAKMSLIWDFIAKVAARRSRIPSVLTPAQTPYDMPYYQATHKAAMELCGIPAGPVRAPMSNLTDSEKEELKDTLIAMGCDLNAPHVAA